MKRKTSYDENDIDEDDSSSDDYDPDDWDDQNAIESGSKHPGKWGKIPLFPTKK